MVNMRSGNPFLFFSKKEKQRILEAVRQAELETSGEIRVHITSHLKGDKQEEGRKLFEKTGMTQTKERNGVLILLAVKDRSFLILGDGGIDEKVPGDFWEKIAQVMRDAFREDRFADGIVEGILKIGTELKTYFPRKRDDANELPDDLSYCP
jgi:uncharacterized membrane protein